MRLLSFGFLVFAGASALQLRSVRPAVRGRAGPATCIAAGDDEKTLLAATKRVTLVAQKFGPTQGKAAQEWVEQAVKSGDASSDSLMQMQLELFAECKLDDESGRCKDLTEAFEALTASVADRKNNPRDTAEFDFNFLMGATPIQEAATKLRATAALFGPEQKEAADVWIKKITAGKETSGAGLLEEQVVLFGECVLSEGSTPSNCQQLEAALAELQTAIETCNVDAPADCDPEVVAAEVKAGAAEVAAKAGGGKRKAVKRLWRKLTGANVLSPLQVASFLADPGLVDAELAGASREELVAHLEEEGLSKSTIDHALTSVLPYLPGQEAPGMPSTEAPR